MRKTTRTIYGAKQQTALNFGLTYTAEENSTLNARFGISDDLVPNEGDLSTVRFYTIGNGGHRAVTGTNGIVYTLPVPHKATDAACFNPIPFVLREDNNDLPSSSREKYALRRTETHDGTTYFAYYGRRLDLSNLSVNLESVSIDENGNKTVEGFSPTNANLNPEPEEIDESDEDAMIIASGEYVSASAILSMSFDEQDAEELRNVATILYGDENYAIISEIGMGAGVDRTVTTSGQGGDISFNEVINSVVTTFISAYYQLSLQNNGFNTTSNVGITEPLFAVTNTE